MHEPDVLDWQIIKVFNAGWTLVQRRYFPPIGQCILPQKSIGYCVLADVFIEVEPGNLREVADCLGEYPQISYIALATGDTDIIVSIRAKEIDELYNFVIETIGKVPGVRHTKTFPLPLNLKDITSWLPPEVINQNI